MYKAYIYLFCLLCPLSQSYASSGGDSLTCDGNLIFDGKIHSSAQVTLVKFLDGNLGLFKITNQSDIDLNMDIAGKQDGYYRHLMFSGYWYMDLSEQKKGWVKTGVYKEEYEEPSNILSILGYGTPEYDRFIILPPKGSIEFITLLWLKKPWTKRIKNKVAVRLYMELRDKEGHYNLIISDPYCL